MTDEHRQRLSQLQDGALDAARLPDLLDALSQDPGQRATWERYHLIGQAMRGETIDPRYRGIADRVRSAIAAEPIPLAPRRRGRLPSLSRRHLTGLALAASAAFIAWIGAPALFEDAVQVPGGGLEAPRLVEQESIPMRRWHLERPELASKLDLYLVTHQATASAAGTKGLLPYATLVGYESPR